MTPRRYIAWGIVLFLLKYAADYLVAHGLYHQDWSLLNYLAPTRLVGLFGWPQQGGEFLMAMLIVALPFMIAGLIVTLGRLRDAALPLVLIVLFFAPFINLLFFLTLCFIPSRRQPPVTAAAPESTPADPIAAPIRPTVPPESPRPLNYAPQSERPFLGPLARFFPARSEPAAVVAALLPIPFAYALCLFSIYFLGDYGWGIFVGLPFILGVVSSILFGMRAPRTAGQCATVGICCVLAASAVLLIFAVEGIICIIMAAPLWIPLTLLGSGVGYIIQKRPLPPANALPMCASLLLALPVLMSLDKATRRPPPLRAVTTSVIIQAPPAVVWRNVIQFPPLPAPTEWLFHTGIAYPTSATIAGVGPGAVRHCVFTTGSFIEPITVWNENRLLRFSVRYNPPVMNEWNFGRRIHPPHLVGFFESQQGQFQLQDLGNGRTRLNGTTWYTHNLWPNAYWCLWTDWIVHRIHVRVLDHVQRLSEQSVRSASANPVIFFAPTPIPKHPK
jgi:hypothetical protein